MTAKGQVSFGLKTGPHRGAWDDLRRIWQEADEIPLIELRPFIAAGITHIVLNPRGRLRPGLATAVTKQVIEPLAAASRLS